MDILMITPEYPPRSIGGGGVVYKNLAVELKRQGHNVKVLAGNFYNRELSGKIERICDSGVEVFFLPLLPAPKVGKMNLVTCTPPTLSALFFLLSELKRPFNIIHLHGVGHLLIDVAALACILLKKRYIFTCHCIPKSPEDAFFIFRWVFKAYLNTLERFIILRAIALTAVSHAILKECCEKNLVNKNMRVIFNGLNLGLPKVDSKIIEKIEEKYSLEERPLIFSIGRLAKVKGFHHLIQAMPHIISKCPNVLAVIAGSGPYESTLEDLIKKKKLSSHVKLVGWITEEEKSALYQRADVIVFPSLYEAFGIVLLEGLMMLKPIIAFNVQPMSEIISNGIDGLLVPLGDEKALAEAVLQVLSDHKLREKLVANAHAKIQLFRWEEIAKKYISLYHLS